MAGRTGRIGPNGPGKKMDLGALIGAIWGGMAGTGAEVAPMTNEAGQVINLQAKSSMPKWADILFNEGRGTREADSLTNQFKFNQLSNQAASDLQLRTKPELERIDTEAAAARGLNAMAIANYRLPYDKLSPEQQQQIKAISASMIDADAALNPRRSEQSLTAQGASIADNRANEQTSIVSELKSKGYKPHAMDVGDTEGLKDVASNKLAQQQGEYDLDRLLSTKGIRSQIDDYRNQLLSEGFQYQLARKPQRQQLDDATTAANLKTAEIQTKFPAVPSIYQDQVTGKVTYPPRSEGDWMDQLMQNPELMGQMMQAIERSKAGIGPVSTNQPTRLRSRIGR